MASNLDASTLLNLLDSSDISAGEEIKELILENLRYSKEAWLLNGVVEFFLVSQSQRCLDILETIREPHDKQLFDKLVECIKGQHRLSAITIVGYLVTKQPPWLHRITSHSLMHCLIKLLKTEVDVPILVSGVLTITSLLPVVPVTIHSHLQELLEAFSRLAAFNFKKPGNIPDIYLMHLHVAIYSLFHRLHGMYPCHLLTYLRSYYRRKENRDIFQNTIAPMLERVKMHPLLVIGSQEKEISRERWRQKEVHDIIVECAQLSLDMIEGTMEKVTCPFSEAMSDIPIRPQHIISQSTGGDDDAENQKSIVNSVTVLDSLWSPSLMCGLSTPPPESASTNVSNIADTNFAGHSSNHSVQPNTPRNTPLVYDSPFPAIDVDKAPLTPVTSQGDIFLPLTPGATGSSKRLSAMSLSLSGKLPTTPTASDSIIPPSPLKFEFSSEPPIHAQKTQAIRKLTFQSSSQSEKTTEEPQVSRSNVQVAEETREAVSKAAHDHKSNTVFESTSKDAVLSPRGKKRPPPLKCMRPSDSFDFISLEDSKPTQVEQHQLPDVSSPSKKDDVELSRSVPSINQLPDIIDSLRRGSVPETGSDEEVQELTGSRDMLDQDDTSDDSYVTPTSALTAQSVKAFMKKVNRIRFNSMNVRSIREEINGEQRPKPSRSNSCPNLDPEFNGSHMYIGENLESRRHRCHSGSGPPADTIQSDSALIKGTVNVSPPIGSTPTKNTSVVSFTTEDVIEEEEDEVDINIVSDNNQDAKAAEEQQVFDNFVAMFPYHHLFPMSLPSAVFMKCYNYQPNKSCNATNSVHDATVPFFASLSPPDLLDRHLKLGADLHRRELEAMQNSTDSSQPAAKSLPTCDDLDILRGQVQLLHNQVMYERHKRELYAKRNRRLLGRITKATALEEQNLAMQDQLRLQEHEIQNLLVTVRLQQQEVQDSRSVKERFEKELCDLQRSSRQEVDNLQCDKRDLQSIIDQKIKDISSLKRDLQDKKSQLFNFVHELNALRAKADIATELQEQVARLNKELLLMGELQQKYQQRLMVQSTMHNPRPEMQFVLETYKQELGSTRRTLDQRTRDYDGLLAYCGQQEETLATKDGTIKEQKQRLEDMDNVVKAQVAAVEAKYSVQKKITTAFSAQILELTARLEQTQNAKSVETKSENMETGASNSTAGSENNQVEFQVEEAKECRETPPSDLSMSPVSPSKSNMGKKQL